MGKSGEMSIKTFWDVMAQFPHINSVRKLEDAIEEMESDGTAYQYPVSYQLLLDFVRNTRSHIYEEWHADTTPITDSVYEN